MIIQINGTDFIFPFTLREDTLGQRIAFQKEHGILLDAMLKDIDALPDQFDKSAEMLQLQFERAFRMMAFYTGIDLEVIRESPFSDHFAAIALQSENDCITELESLRFQLTHLWRGEVWEMNSPELTQSSRITFGEFIDSKEMLKHLTGKEASKWEYLLPLAVIFLRRVGEPYDETFMYPGSERLKLMETLPLDIALQVGFFLMSYQSFAVSIFPYSEKEVLNQESFRVRTWNVGLGLLSLNQLRKRKFLTWKAAA